MSNSIDNRVVKMEFDNKGFEHGVKTSLLSLEKLKQGLDMDKAVASLQNLETTFSNFSLGGIEDALEHISDSFSAFGVLAASVLQNITSRAVDAGINMVKALSIDNVRGGFGKYEQMMNATQTMKNATGSDVETITGYLDKLMTYTDETSYSYTEMVSAMGRFTSAGVDLKTSEMAVQGIANAAADAGIGINEASRLFEIFSKSMSSGHLGRNQWDSLALSNFNTPKFQKALIAAGKAIGTIDAKTGKLAVKGKKVKAMVVNYDNLAESLKYGWANQEVLNLALAAYGDETDAAAKKLAEFDNELSNVGSSAYESAKVAKTFTDVIDSVKDAISSGWMTSFTHIFGGLEESMKFWTDVANGIINIVADIAERRNKVLEGWKAHGGYDDLTEGVMNVIAIFQALYDTARIALDMFTSGNAMTVADSEVGALQFAETFGTKLMAITSAFKETTANILSFWTALNYGTEDDQTTIYFNDTLIKAFRGLYAVIGMVVDVVTGLFRGIGKIGAKFAPLGGKMIQVFGKAGVALEGIYKHFHEKKVVDGWMNTIIDGFQPIFDLIPGALEWVDKFLNHIGLTETSVKGFSKAIEESDAPLFQIIRGLKSLFDILSEFVGFGAGVFSRIVAAIAPYAGKFITWIADMAGNLGAWITKVKESGVITDILTDWTGKIGGVIDTLTEWKNKAIEWIDSTGILPAIQSQFEEFGQWLHNAFFGKGESDNIEEFSDEIQKKNGLIDAAQDLLGKFHKKLTDLADWLKKNSLVDMMSNFFGSGATFVSHIFEKIGNFFATDTSGIEGTGNKLAKRLDAFKKLDENGNVAKDSPLNGFIEMLKGLATNLNKLDGLKADLGFDKGVLDGIFGTINYVFNWVGTIANDFASKFSLGNVAKLGLGGFVGGGLVKMVIDIFKGIEGFAKTSELLGNISDSVSDIGANLASEGIKGLITGGKGKRNAIEKVFDELEGMAQSFLFIAGGIWLMADAMNKLKGMNIEEITKTLIGEAGAGGILALIVNFTKSFEEEFEKTEGGATFKTATKKFTSLWDGVAFLAIAQAINMMADGLETLCEIEKKYGSLWNEIGEEAVLGGVLALIKLIAGSFSYENFSEAGSLFGQSTKNVKKFGAQATLWDDVAFLAIAKAIQMMADGLKTLVELEDKYGDVWRDIKKVGALGGILAAIKFIGNSFTVGDFKISAGGALDSLSFVEIAQALNMMGDGLLKLAQVDDDKKMTNALWNMTKAGGLLGALKAVLDKLNNMGAPTDFKGAIAKAIGGSGVGFLAIAEGLNVLADALIKLSQIDDAWKEVGELGALGGITAVLTGFLGKMSPKEAAQAVGNVGIIITETAGIFTALGVLKDTLQNNNIVDIDAALESASKTMRGLGKAIGSLFGGIAEGVSGKTASQQLVEELTGETGSLSESLTNVTDFSDKLKNVNFDLIDRFIQTIQGLNITSTEATSFPYLGNQVQTLGEKFNSFASNVSAETVTNAANAAKIVESFIKISGLINSSSAFQNGADMSSALSNFMAGATLQGTVDVGGLVGEFASSFVKEFSKGIQNESDETDSAATVLMTQTLTKLGEFTDRFKDMGRNVSIGLAEGIEEKESRVKEAITKIGKACCVTFQYTVDEHSPSRLFARFGNYLDLGLVEGIEDGQRDVEKAIKDLGLSVASTAENSLNGERFTVSPVVTPVLDDARFLSGVAYMNSALQDTRDILVPGFGRGTIQTELVSSTNSNGIIDAITQVNTRIADLGEAIQSMQIVLNSGALVGSISADMDRSLGLRAIREGRRG